jgi:methanogenic corrinoid protein MtbC1
MESLPQEHTGMDVMSRRKSHRECDMELPGFRPDEAANDMRMSRLARTIEEEIIPRLMLAHRTFAEPMVQPAGPHADITAEDVKQFAKLVLSHDEDIAFSTIHLLRARDVPVEKIYVDLLAPTARYLGHLWDEDLCDFTDVTVGLGRLQRVLRELSSALGSGLEHASGGRRILLLPSPGEQHTFGLVMVAEFFRSAGWDVIGGAWAEGADAATMVAGEWFDVVGFSLGAEIRLAALATTIEAVRHATCNRELAVLVGGPLFGEHPEYMKSVGADGMTIDGREAPLLAESLITRSLQQRGSPG